MSEGTVPLKWPGARVLGAESAGRHDSKVARWAETVMAVVNLLLGIEQGESNLKVSERVACKRVAYKKFGAWRPRIQVKSFRTLPCQ